IGPDPRNFNQRVSLGRNDLLIRTFPSSVDLVSVFAGRALMDELVNRKDFCIFILMYLIDIMKIIYI
ncbi:hypothetical protein M8371_31430, partial [Klebsiella pneumoniae]|nr:hypothetical protein [Klebsiella pneumoniae]